MENKRKKIALLIIISVICFMIVSLAISEAFKASDNMTNQHKSNYPQVYKTAVAKQQPVFVFFYADWCSHCVNFMPKLKELEKKYQGKYNFVTVNVDKNENIQLAKDFYVAVLPTVFVVDPTSNKRFKIDSYTLHDDIALDRELCKHIKSN